MVQEGSGGPPGGTGEVERSTQRFQRGREVHPEVWQESGSLPGGPGGVGWPTQRSGKGREAHSEDLEESGGSARRP